MSVSFQNITTVKRTRRNRRCNWCEQVIKAGEPSVVVCGVCDGDFFNSRYHPECSSAITRYCMVNNCFGEELPDFPMNRGGINEAGEPETDVPVTNLPEDPVAFGRVGG